ncbi:MAG: ribose-phosphate pyrophosphokinase [Lachnospiraceae bacterium]
MSEHDNLENILPVGPLKIAALEGCREFGKTVDGYLTKSRQDAVKKHPSLAKLPGYVEDSYLLSRSCPRFGTGEGKGQIHDSVRGADLYILVDVCNYSLTYKVCGFENHMSPDNHFQDFKRIISAATGKAKRISVVMPFLCEGRQHKRTKREFWIARWHCRSLSIWVSNIITFDAHDPRVQNAIPLSGFDSFMPTYQFLKALVDTVPDFRIDNDHLMVISPDEGAMSRAVYFSSILGVDMGMFYKRRDYSTVINGRNPIVAHEFLGDSVEGKDVIIVDDMISSGDSMLDVAKQVKSRGAKRVFVCTTFGLFTDGLEKFDEYYEKGYITKVLTTNLNYRDPELLSRPYYAEADMTRFLAMILEHLNHDVTLSTLESPTNKINDLLGTMRVLHSGKKLDTWKLP